METQAQAEKVKVKILHPVGRYMPGQEVEVSPEDAKALCRDTAKGRLAMTLAEIKDLQDAPVDELFSDEMALAGRKNIVATPVDPALKAKMDELASKKDLPIDDVAQAKEEKAAATKAAKAAAKKEQ